MQKTRSCSAPRPGPAAGSLRGGGMRPAGRPRRGRARAPPAGRPPCPSARFLRRRLRGERGARLLSPRPAPAGVGEAAEAPPAPPTPEAAGPPRGHLRRWHHGSPSAGGGSASPLPSSPHRPGRGGASHPGPAGRPGSLGPHARRGPTARPPPGRGPPRPAARRCTRGGGGGGARGRRSREMPERPPARGGGGGVGRWHRA